MRNISLSLIFRRQPAFQITAKKQLLDRAIVVLLSFSSLRIQRYLTKLSSRRRLDSTEYFEYLAQNTLSKRKRKLFWCNRSPTPTWSSQYKHGRIWLVYTTKESHCKVCQARVQTTCRLITNCDELMWLMVDFTSVYKNLLENQLENEVSKQRSRDHAMSDYNATWVTQYDWNTRSHARLQ